MWSQFTSTEVPVGSERNPRVLHYVNKKLKIWMDRQCMNRVFGKKIKVKIKIKMKKLL
jgi:hypothetical protein